MFDCGHNFNLTKKASTGLGGGGLNLRAFRGADVGFKVCTTVVLFSIHKSIHDINIQNC